MAFIKGLKVMSMPVHPATIFQTPCWPWGTVGNETDCVFDRDLLHRDNKTDKQIKQGKVAACAKKRQVTGDR